MPLKAEFAKQSPLADLLQESSAQSVTHFENSSETSVKASKCPRSSVFIIMKSVRHLELPR
jgi:hypothetical protein